MVSKYTIHITPVKRLLYRKSTDCEYKHCAAVICSSDFRQITKQIPFQHYILLEFHDTDDPTNGNAFSPEQAEKIAHFLSGLSTNISDLYIACDAGCSRSPAIAAALFRASHRSDLFIWKNPRYYPNPLVYKAVCRAYHLYTPKIMVNLLVRINRKAYRIAQRNRR